MKPNARPWEAPGFRFYTPEMRAWVRHKPLGEIEAARAAKEREEIEARRIENKRQRLAEARQKASGGE